MPVPLETWWEAQSGKLARSLASFSRLILFDLRGTGLSDRPDHITVKEWVDDVRVVLDAVGVVRVSMVGLGPGGPIATRFTTTHPSRVQALVLHVAFARTLRADDYPIGGSDSDADRYCRAIEATWGRIDQLDPEMGMDIGLAIYCPSAASDPAARELWARWQRISTSPAGAVAYNRLVLGMDVRPNLGDISIPTLVLHPSCDRALPIEFRRHLAEHIPSATFVQLDSEDHVIWLSDAIGETAMAIQSSVMSHRTSVHNSGTHAATDKYGIPISVRRAERRFKRRLGRSLGAAPCAGGMGCSTRRMPWTDHPIWRSDRTIDASARTEERVAKPVRE